MHILIADDHHLFREGIHSILLRLSDIIISKASNFDEITQVLKSTQPDILLLDLNMPGVINISQVKEICNLAPKVAVLVLSGNENPHVIASCLQAGAAGFLPKSAPLDLMFQAIQAVYNGEKFIPKFIEPLIHVALSPRQTEILSLITQGTSNKNIAYQLSISESTVKQHITEIFRKLHVSNRVEAIQASKDMLISIL